MSYGIMLLELFEAELCFVTGESSRRTRSAWSTVLVMFPTSDTIMTMAMLRVAIDALRFDSQLYQITYTTDGRRFWKAGYTVLCGLFPL